MVCWYVPKVKICKIQSIFFQCILPNQSVGELSFAGSDPNDQYNPTKKADSSSSIPAEMSALVLGPGRVARHLLDVLELISPYL